MTAKFQAILDTLPQTGSKNFTISGFGTPKAAIFITTNADDSATEVADSRQCIGFLADNQWSSSLFEEDGAGSAILRRAQSTGRAITLPNNGAASIRYTGSLITDGVSLTLSEGSTSVDRYVHVILIGGTDVTAHVGTLASISGTSAISETGVGFEPDLVFAATTGSGNTSGSNENFGIYSWGAAARNGAGIDQFLFAYRGDNGAGTTSNRGWISSSNFLGQLGTGGSTPNWQASVDSFDSDGFTYTPDSNAGGDDAGYLALKINGSHEYSIGTGDVTTSASQTVTAGFEPDLSFVTFVAFDAADEGVDAADNFGIGYTVASSDGVTTTVETLSLYSEDDVTTSNVASRYDTGVYCPTHTGGTLLDGTAAFGSTGLDLTLSTTPGTTRRLVAFHFREDAGAADTTAPILSGATDSANGAAAATGSVSTDEGNGTLYWVVTTSATAPSVAQIQAGQDNSGVAAAASGSQTVSATGAQAITPSGLASSTAYTTHFQHTDAAGNDSTVVSASGFTTASGDVTAPILSSPSGVVASATSADLSVSTDEGNGTLYWVVTTSATSPSVAQVQAGQDHTGASATSGNQAVSGTGTQNATATGLTTDTTYYAHFQHADAAANDSTVSSSASFTPSSETTVLADDFDSAAGTATVTDGTTLTPTITISETELGDHFNVYIKVSGVNNKTPDVVVEVDLNEWRPELIVDWNGAFWRYTDDGSGSQIFPDEWSEFDTVVESPTDTFTCTNSSAFTQDEIEICVTTQRWRYMDTKRTVETLDADSTAFELASSIAESGLPKNVHYQISVSSATRGNTAPYGTLNLYCIGFEDTGVSPDGGAEKLNIVNLIKQHSMEDEAAYAGWSFVNFFCNGTGTTADWLRKHCILYCYDVNPAGQYWGENRNTVEDGGKENPNRAWEITNTSSEQVNVVRSVIESDCGRVDVFFDWHGAQGLNRVGGDQFGAYENVGETASANFRTRLNSLLPSGVTFGDLNDTDGTFAQDWALAETDAQLSVTMENPKAAPNAPIRADMYDYYVEDVAGALELMVDNSELTLTGGGSTVEAAAQSMSLTTNAAQVLTAREIAAALQDIALQSHSSVVSLNSTIGAQVLSMALTTNAAAVSSDRQILANVQSIEVDTFAADTSAGSQISAAVKSLELQPLTASISADNAIQAALQQLSVTTNAASVSTGSNVGAQALELAVDTLQAGITLDVSISGSLQEITVEALAASVGLGAQIDAFVQNLELTPQGATVDFSGGIEGTLAQLEMTTFDAVVTGSTAAITAPGLEFTFTDNRLHYTLPINRIHFTFPEED